MKLFFPSVFNSSSVKESRTLQKKYTKIPSLNTQKENSIQQICRFVKLSFIKEINFEFSSTLELVLQLHQVKIFFFLILLLFLTNLQVIFFIVVIV